MKQVTKVLPYLAKYVTVNKQAEIQTVAILKESCNVQLQKLEKKLQAVDDSAPALSKMAVSGRGWESVDSSATHPVLEKIAEQNTPESSPMLNKKFTISPNSSKHSNYVQLDFSQPPNRASERPSSVDYSRVEFNPVTRKPMVVSTAGAGMSSETAESTQTQGTPTHPAPLLQDSSQHGSETSSIPPPKSKPIIPQPPPPPTVIKQNATESAPSSTIPTALPSVNISGDPPHVAPPSFPAEPLALGINREASPASSGVPRQDTTPASPSDPPPSVLAPAVSNRNTGEASPSNVLHHQGTPPMAPVVPKSSGEVSSASSGVPPPSLATVVYRSSREVSPPSPASSDIPPGGRGEHASSAPSSNNTLSPVHAAGSPRKAKSPPPPVAQKPKSSSSSPSRSSGGAYRVRSWSQYRSESVSSSSSTTELSGAEEAHATLPYANAKDAIVLTEKTRSVMDRIQVQPPYVQS